MTILYVPLRISRWSTLRLQGPHGPGEVGSGPGVGFLVAFRTEAEAAAAYPGATISAISVPSGWLSTTTKEVA